MNKIIQSSVYKKNGTPVTDSIKVAGVFGKQHKNIMQAIRNILGSAENSAHRKWFCESMYCDTQGKKQPMFLMTRDGFSLLAMGLTGAKAMQFKVAFIEQFNEMEKVVRQVVQPTTPAIPQTFAEALRLAASQAEQIEEQQKQIEAQAPKVAFANAILASRNSCLVGELAKIISQNGYIIGQNRLFKWLRDNHYLGKSGEYYNIPNQQYIEQGLFEVKRSTRSGSGGEMYNISTTKVTPKGQEYFIRKFTS